MRSFDECWQYSNTIPGSFTEAEARVMYEELIKLPDESVVVEIGSYMGRSASLIGQVAQDKGFEFVCVDNFVTGFEDKSVQQELRNNLDRNKVRYVLFEMYSRRAAKLFDYHEVDFVFIDGDHRYEGCFEDINLWLPRVKQNGLVAFHDYNSSWIGVRKAVDEIKVLFEEETAKVDSLLICRKKI